MKPKYTKDDRHTCPSTGCTRDESWGRKVKEDDTVMAYNMTNQEVRLQHEEEKYEVYMSTFGYEGDDSNLDSKTDTDSNVTAYPFLG